MELNYKYYKKYLKYKQKYINVSQYPQNIVQLSEKVIESPDGIVQLGGNISLWGYIQNILSNISVKDKIVANTILASLGISFDNLSYKNYPNKDEGTLISRRTEFIKLLQMWKNNNLKTHTALILDMYKNDLDIIKIKVFELIKINNNIVFNKHEICSWIKTKVFYDSENELLSYLRNFYNDIFQYCDNEIIINVLITWLKNIYNNLNNNKKSDILNEYSKFCILIILFSYSNISIIDSFNKNRLSKIIYKIINFYQDFINLKKNK